MNEGEIIHLAYLLGSGYRRSGMNVQFSCPNARYSPAHRGDDYHHSFGVMISHGRSVCNCFACHLKGDLISVFYRLLKAGIVDEEVYGYVKTIEAGDLRATLEKLQARRNGNHFREPKKKEFNVGTFSRRCEGRRSDIVGYLRSRGITEHEAQKYSLGFDPEAGRLTFPIFTRQGVVGCIGRSLNGREPKYYKYPALRDDVLLGENHLDVTLQELSLVEGPVDMIKTSRVVRNVLALNGLTLTPKQKERLLVYADEITLIFDGDEAGRSGLERIGKALCRRARVFVLVLPDGSDPGSLDEDALAKLYASRYIFHV